MGQEEEIIELTEVVEEDEEETPDTDEIVIQKAFESDEFFSELETLDDLVATPSETEEKKEGEASSDEESVDIDRLLSEDEGQAAAPETESSMPPADSEPSPMDAEEPEAAGGDDQGREAEEAELTPPSLDGDTESDTEKAQEDLPAEEAEDTGEDGLDEFDALEDFKLEVPLPEEPSDTMKAVPVEEGAPPESGEERLPPPLDPLSVPESEEMERLLGRVAYGILAETAERVFTRVAEKVLREEMARIREEIRELVDRK